MFVIIHEAASLRMCRKLNVMCNYNCDFYRHCKLAKFSSPQINISGCMVYAYFCIYNCRGVKFFKINPYGPFLLLVLTTGSPPLFSVIINIISTITVSMIAVNVISHQLLYKQDKPFCVAVEVVFTPVWKN